MKSVKKYLVVSIILIAVGLLGLSINSIVAKYKYGSYEGYDWGSNFKTDARNMFGIGTMMDMMDFSLFSNEGSSKESYSFIEIKQRTENYLESNNLEDLHIVEIMEFSNNFYMEIAERDTDLGAMELLLDKSTGNIFPEYGPNMMWNAKYGMHMGINQTDTDMPIDEEEAIQLAEQYLNKINSNEFIGEEAARYYGYYTIHTVTEKGDIVGMLSVNGNTGQVWYHSWHGTFIGMEEYEVH